MSPQRPKLPSEKTAQDLAQDAGFQLLVGQMRQARAAQARFAGRMAAVFTGAGIAAVYLVISSLSE